LAGALLLQLTSDLMPVGFLASPYVCSSRDREPRAPVCPPVEAFIFQKTLLFIDPPFTRCFNSINSSWFCFLELYFSVFQKIWHGAQCPLRPIESKSSRGRTQEFASLSVCLFLSFHLFSLLSFLIGKMKPVMVLNSPRSHVNVHNTTFLSSNQESVQKARSKGNTITGVILNLHNSI